MAVFTILMPGSKDKKHKMLCLKYMLLSTEVLRPDADNAEVQICWSR